MRSFARHYAEMVIAMFAGMFILGLPAEAGEHEAAGVALLIHATILVVSSWTL